MQRTELSIAVMGACPVWEMLCFKRLPILLQKAISKDHSFQITQEPAPEIIPTVTINPTEAT